MIYKGRRKNFPHPLNLRRMWPFEWADSKTVVSYIWDVDETRREVRSFSCLGMDYYRYDIGTIMQKDPACVFFSIMD